MRGILLGLADVFGTLLWLYQILILASVVLSWVNADPYNGIVRGIRGLTDPVFAWLRRRLPFLVQNGLDLSPLAAILICVFLKWAFVYNLQIFAARF
jgi:YggT family protein